MINPAVFANEMALLQERFSRELSQSVLDRYYELLSSRLDDEQFQDACLKVFDEEDFFPSPKKFVDAAQSLHAAIAAELKRLNLSGILPDDWQLQTGVTTIGQLATDDARRYLFYLKGVANALPAA